jgi:hypothetical protein
MFKTPDGVAVYTQEDVDALSRQMTQNYEDGKGMMHRKLRGEALDWFKGEVRSGAMEKEDAEGIFNGLAGALGWAEVENISPIYTVSVHYNGEIIAEFSDIEADDEDGAVEEVENNLEVTSAEIRLHLTYNGHTESGSADMTYDFDASELEISATEIE